MVSSKIRVSFSLSGFIAILMLAGFGLPAFAQQSAAPLSPGQVQEQFKNLQVTDPQKAQEIQKTLEQACPSQAQEIQKALESGDIAKAKELFGNLNKSGCPAAPTGSMLSNEPSNELSKEPGKEPAIESGKEPSKPPETAVPEQPSFSEIEQFFSSKVNRTQIAPAPINLRQYGYDVFRETVSTFAPVTDVPVSADYIIGPGDEFTVTIWGMVEGIYKLEVDRNGEVVLPKAGVVSVAGLRYSELKTAIQRQLGKYYKDFNLSVSMGRLRSIRVYVVGEVTRPGSYTLSSLSTAYNALFAAGGPTKRGTLRDIQLIRNGKVIARMDLYDFLLKGDKSQDPKLMHEDTILVPLIGRLVGIAGDVMRPAIYEIKGSGTLKEAIDLAGGIRPMGYLQRVQVERILAHEKKIVVDLNLSEENKPDRLKIPLENMDIIQIFPIMDRTQDVVYLKGHVVRPGSYQFKPGMRVTDVVKSYQDLLPEPYPDYAEVIRYTLPDYHRVVRPFNLGKALAGDPNENLKLENLDEVRIYPESYFQDLQQVSIQGVVRNPGSYHLYKDMTVSELIHQAGDVTDAAFLERGEIHRRVDPSDPTYTRRIIYFNLGKVLAGDPAENLTLQSQDQVVVYSKEDVRPGPTVSVDGQVRSAGVVPLLKDMRVRDLIFEAGLKNVSSLKEAELTRYTVTHNSPEKVETQRISIDLEKALADDPSQNLALKEHDHLMVKAIPGLELDRKVTITGEVRFPGSYLIKKGDRMSDLLDRAGGFTDKAFLKGAIFTRDSVRRLEQEQLSQFIKAQEQKLVGMAAATAASGISKEETQAEQLELSTRQEALKLMASQVVLGRVVIHIAPAEKLKGGPDDILLEDGDTLHIPQPPSAVAVLGSVRSATAILYEPGAGMDYYVDKAGGYTKEADKGEAYILKADGSTVIPGVRTEVEAGDAIIVPGRMDVKYKPLPFWRDIATIVGQFAVMIAALTVVF
jgi:polysaccharide biosynthesis/export protein